MFSEKFSKYLVWIGLGFVVLASIMFFAGEIQSLSWFKPIKSDKVGQFGDFFGGVVGAIWALAGVIMIYEALKEQRKATKNSSEALTAQIQSLNTQIEEFKLQRQELEETRKVFIEQGRTLKKQQFESTFFQLLNLHNQNVKALACQELQERYAISKMFENFDRRYNYKTRQVESIKSNFKHEYEKNRIALGHYFRTLYHILNFIDKTKGIKRREYSNILRAQLSSIELEIIFFYGLLDTNVRTKKLFEKYALFKYISTNNIHKELRKLYSESAFASSLSKNPL